MTKRLKTALIGGTDLLSGFTAAPGFVFYSSTGFQDSVSFVAGILYGVILEGYGSVELH